MTKSRSNATAPNAKGTLVVGNGTDASTTLAVASTAGYVLTVDSAEATGLKWASPAGSIPDFSLITTLTFAGNASYTATGLGSYNQIYCALFGVSADSNGTITYRFNSDTANNYAYQYADMYMNGNTYSTANVYMSNTSSTGTGTQYIYSQGTTDGDYVEGYIHYQGTKSTGPKLGYQWFSANGGEHSNYVGPVQYLGTSAISSITFTSTNALDSGTVKIYGSAV